MSRVRALGVIWAAVAAVAAQAAVDGTYRYSRELQVAQPGWVRVRLPLEVLNRLGPGGDDLFVLDPSGAPLPAYPWSPPPEMPPSERALQPVAMTTTAGGWQVSFDCGRRPVRHRLLMVELPGTGLAQEVRLDGSHDNTSWRMLAQGSMFRLSRWKMTEKTYLEYPAASERYLRLFWPESAGFPRWSEVWVLDWPDQQADVVEEPVQYEERAGGGTSGYRFALPRTGLPGAALLPELDHTYPVWARLAVAREGRWDGVVENLLLPDRPAAIGVPPVVFGPPVVLSLSAGTFPVPPLRGLRLRYRPSYVVFKAGAAGTHTLCYGLRVRHEAPRSAAVLPAAAAPPLDVSPGPERAHPSAPTLPAATLTGGALPAAGFGGRWPIEAPGARKGGLVQLELPADVYGVARIDLGDLRIGHGGKQVPYLLVAAAEGREVEALRAVSPQPTGAYGLSAVSIALPAASLPLAALDLEAPGTPFSRPVRLESPRPPNPEENPLEEHWLLVASSVWRSAGGTGVPARLAIPIGGAGGRVLRVLFQDGDNAPLSGVSIVLWRRAHTLVFPWPGDGLVELLAGSSELGAPRYDLASAGHDLILDATVHARLRGVGPGSGEQLAESPLVRWALLIGLAAAAIVLVAILARSLRGQSGGPPAES